MQFRSSVSSLKEEIVERNKSLTEVLGGTFTANAGYPEWPYKSRFKNKRYMQRCIFIECTVKKQMLLLFMQDWNVESLRKN